MRSNKSRIAMASVEARCERVIPSSSKSLSCRNVISGDGLIDAGYKLLRVAVDHRKQRHILRALQHLLRGFKLLAMKRQLRPIVTFIVLTLLFSSAPYLLIIHSHRLGIGCGLVTGVLMWMPALAACATCRLLNIDLATLGWCWRPAHYEGLAYLLPILYPTPVYVACWIFLPHSLGFGAFANAAVKSYAMPGSPGGAAVLSLTVLATFGLVRSLAAALGEEIGWRGFLLPRLTGRFGFSGGCLISGGI